MGLVPWEPVGARVMVWAMNSDQRRAIDGWCRRFGIRTVEKIAMRLVNVPHTEAKGFYWNDTGFAARIQVRGRKINLGTYRTKEEAHAAYLRGRAKYL